MEAVLCPGLLVLKRGRMSYGVGEGVSWDQFRLFNNGKIAGYLTHCLESKIES